MENYKGKIFFEKKEPNGPKYQFISFQNIDNEKKIILLVLDPSGEINLDENIIVDIDKFNEMFESVI